VNQRTAQKHTQTVATHAKTTNILTKREIHRIFRRKTFYCLLTMNIDSIKVELIDWIAKLNDQKQINELLTLKKQLSAQSKSNQKIFGSGKHLIEFIDDDFNAPLDQFRDYQK